MPVQQQVVELFRRFGAPVRFAVKTILGAALPGSGAVINLVEAVLDCARDAGKGEYEFDAARLPKSSPEDMRRVEQILEMMRGDLNAVLAKVAAQKDPGRQQQVLDEMLKSSAASRTAVGELGNLARQIHAKVEDIHTKVEDIYNAVYQLLEERKTSGAPAAGAASGALTIEPGQYDKLLTTDNPACLLLLVDQSRSMNRPFGRQPGLRKKDGVAVMLNSILDSLCLDVGRGDKLYIGAIGYGGQIGSILEGPLADKELVTTSDLLDHTLQVLTVTVTKTNTDGTLRKKRKQARVWVRPRADGATTPMKEAFEKAHALAAGFLKRHPHCFPPIVLNFSDGEPTTAPEAAADALRRLTSTNGAALVFNAHLSENDREPLLFPNSEDVLPTADKLARRIFRLSSVLPDILVQRAREGGQLAARGARGFAFNGDLDAVSRLLEVGTSKYQGQLADLLPGIRGD